ncbi:MAG TPA: PadR family transcriptional regulator, partial [Planctomycetota bacterium]|nr:PadR family transcriptional regulator [Planctomycetota bacterium]
MTQAEFLILGLVAECPAHGYQLERSTRALAAPGVPTIGLSSIYLVLRSLQSIGAVEGLLEPGARGPARNRFSITAAGRALLQEQIHAAFRDGSAASDLALGFL